MCGIPSGCDLLGIHLRGCRGICGERYCRLDRLWYECFSAIRDDYLEHCNALTDQHRALMNCSSLFLPKYIQAFQATVSVALWLRAKGAEGAREGKLIILASHLI